jgi:hypothetical protein
MGDEENRMPKNARREKNSKKASEREREKKRETERERERERESSQRKNSNTICGDKEDGRIIPKGPCHIYICYSFTSIPHIPKDQSFIQFAPTKTNGANL